MARELTVWKPSRELAPFREFERMRKELDRLWDSFLERGPRTGEAGEWYPFLDVAETKNDIIVKAEIPGMDPKEIDIALSKDLLTIKGEKKEEREEKEENYHLIERSHGKFIRSVQLPGEVKSDKIRASYKNGVLTITLPKSEETKKREVKIRVS